MGTARSWLILVAIAIASANDCAAEAPPPSLVFCVRCHGVDGISPNELWPNLAGQNAAYLRQQLHAFRSGTRRDAFMQSWARLPEESEIEALARYFAGLPRDGSGGSAVTPLAVREPSGRSGPMPVEAPSHVVPAWFLGMPVVLHGSQVFPPGRLSAREAERLGRSGMRVYVVAPVRPGIGASPARRLRVRGRDVFLPDHQATLTRLCSPQAPLLGIGYFVERGPRGDTGNVRVQAQPADAWPRAPLASAIRIGSEWVGLDSHLTVEYGLATGVLALEYFDASDRMWATLDWEQYQPQPGLTPSCDAATAADARAP